MSMHPRDSTHTLVTGPAGAGKTTLVEALVRSTRKRRLVVGRLAYSAGLEEAQEQLVRDGSEQLARYKQAGADQAVVVRHGEENGYPDPIDLRRLHLFGLDCGAMILEGTAAYDQHGAFRVMVTRIFPEAEAVISRQEVEGCSAAKRFSPKIWSRHRRNPRSRSKRATR